MISIAKPNAVVPGAPPGDHGRGSELDGEAWCRSFTLQAEGPLWRRLATKLVGPGLQLADGGMERFPPPEGWLWHRPPPDLPVIGAALALVPLAGMALLTLPPMPIADDLDHHSVGQVWVFCLTASVALFLSDFGQAETAAVYLGGVDSGRILRARLLTHAVWAAWLVGSYAAPGASRQHQAQDQLIPNAGGGCAEARTTVEVIER